MFYKLDRFYSFDNVTNEQNIWFGEKILRTNDTFLFWSKASTDELFPKIPYIAYW